VSEQHLARACHILERLVAEDATDRDSRLALAQAEGHRFVHFLLGRRMDLAAASFHAARGILEELVEEFPKEPRYRIELADALSLAGARLNSLTETEAEEYLQRAVDATVQLTSAFPSVPEYQALLAASYRNLARLHQRLGRLDQAEAELERAEERLASLATRYPAHRFYPLSLAMTSLDLAELKRTRSEKEQDPARMEAARDVLERATARFPLGPDGGDPFRRRIAERLYRSLAGTLRALGDESAADEAARNAQEFAPGFFRNPPGKLDDRPLPPPPKES
jgi:tetratricopeptide (TPR) repeat protein